MMWRSTLAARCVFVGDEGEVKRAPCSDARLHVLDKCPARRGIYHRHHRDQPHRSLAMPGEHHLFPGPGTADKFGKLGLGVGYGNLHRSGFHGEIFG